MRHSMIVFAALSAAACAGSPAPIATAPKPAPAPVAAPVTPPPAVVQPTPPAPAPSTAFDAEGNYDLQVTFGGTQLPLLVELWRENGKWRGGATLSNLGGADLTNLV